MADPANTDYVSRANLEGTIPEDVAPEIIDGAIEASAALSLFPRVTMSAKITRLPVLSLLPVAYWVNGDIGLKRTTKMAWDKKFLEAEELAVIVPVPDAVVEDSAFDIWAEIKPRLVEAIGAKLDAAIFFGVEKPASYPTAIVDAATLVGNVFERGTSTQAQGGIAEDVNQVMGLVETDGFDVNGFVTKRRYRAILRGARDTSGQKLLDLSQNEIEGSPVYYAPSDLWTEGNEEAELLAGDFSQGILGIRRDITYKVLTEAVIQDGDGEIVYNLAQQDMTALRVTFRAGFQVANPINRSNPNDTTGVAGAYASGDRYPFAVLTSPAS